MMNKRIKVFLGGYVNSINAQNLNCRSLALHLDKTRFEVGVMIYPGGGLPVGTEFDGIKKFSLIFKLYRPLYFLRYINYFRGLIWCDVAYLPKGEIDGFCRAVARIFGTKVFTTLEGIIDDTLIERMGRDLYRRRLAQLRKYSNDNLFAITEYIKAKEAKDKNLPIAGKVLYLGVDSSVFVVDDVHPARNLRNIIFIGNDPVRKNLYDLFGAAREFPEITFHIVGGNQLKDCTVEEYISRNGLDNVTYHGRLDHTALSRLLAGMDLMYFPSRSEGFPKVHLETACAGVPTLCYGDYGAAEWIDSWRNGIIVNNRDEALDAIRRLQANPALLQPMSAQAVELGKRFDWKNLVRNWEEVIEEIAR